MHKGFFIFFIGLILAGCNNYKNKPRYEITINETVEIYHSTNSCCYYCISNEKDLKHIKLVENKTIDPGPEDCDGCNSTGAFVFAGTSPGIDTVELKLLVAREDCDSNNVQPENILLK